VVGGEPDGVAATVDEAVADGSGFDACVEMVGLEVLADPHPAARVNGVRSRRARGLNGTHVSLPQAAPDSLPIKGFVNARVTGPSRTVNITRVRISGEGGAR
jgi:hypothetical protein